MSSPDTNIKILSYSLRLELIQRSIAKQLNGISGQPRRRRCYLLWCSHILEELA